MTSLVHANPPKLQLVALIPYAFIACVVFSGVWFTFLQTDDFCAFARVADLSHGNPFLDTAFMYQHWAGRYSSMFLVALAASASEIAPAEYVYEFSLAIFLFVFAWSCLRVSRMAGPEGKTNVALAAVIFCGSLLLVPSKLEQYLWLTGAAVYFFGCSLLLAFVQIATTDHPLEKASPLREIGILALIVAIVGFNEFLALIAGACIFWLLLQTLLERNGSWRWPAIRLVVFSAAFAVSVFAPGNFVRDATSSANRHAFGSATSLAIDSLLQFLVVVSSRDILAICAVLAASAAAGALSGPVKPPLFKRWGALMLILIAAFPMHLWVYSFLTGEPTPGRVINQALMLALAAACVLAAAIGENFLARRLPLSNGQVATAVFGVAGLILAGSHNSRELTSTTWTFGPNWRAQQIARDNGFASLPKGITSPAYVRPYARNDSDPPTFAGADIQGSPDYWVNKCVAGYYHVPSVQLMRETLD